MKKTMMILTLVGISMVSQLGMASTISQPEKSPVVHQGVVGPIFTTTILVPQTISPLSISRIMNMTTSIKR